MNQPRCAHVLRSTVENNSIRNLASYQGRYPCLFELDGGMKRSAPIHGVEHDKLMNYFFIEHSSL